MAAICSLVGEYKNNVGHCPVEVKMQEMHSYRMLETLLQAFCESAFFRFLIK